MGIARRDFQYPDGMTAAVQNKFGSGRTLLIGTFPGAGYFLHHGLSTKDVFAALLAMAGVTQAVKLDDAQVQARLHRGEGGTYLWVTNPSREERTGEDRVLAGCRKLQLRRRSMGKPEHIIWRRADHHQRSRPRRSCNYVAVGCVHCVCRETAR